MSRDQVLFYYGAARGSCFGTLPHFSFSLQAAGPWALGEAQAALNDSPDGARGKPSVSLITVSYLSVFDHTVSLLIRFHGRQGSSGSP
jgi:hypothetical protein